MVRSSVSIRSGLFDVMNISALFCEEETFCSISWVDNVKSKCRCFQNSLKDIVE